MDNRSVKGKLIVVTDRRLCRRPFLQQVEILARAKVDAIVLREKDLPEWEYEALAGQVLAICKEYGVRCILHQNISVARRLGADSLHLSLAAAKGYSRQEWQDRLADREGGGRSFGQIGFSVHSLEELETAQELGADYVFFGHVFATACKPGAEPRGLEALHEICREAKVPVFAIGGISPENAWHALEAGAAGVCVMSWGMQADEAQLEECFYTEKGK